MQIKWIGAVLVLIGCAGIGMYMAVQYRLEIKYMRSLQEAVQFMTRELGCRLTPLPELFSKTAKTCGGQLRVFFQTLSEELDRQVAPDVSTCIRSTLHRLSNIPQSAAGLLSELGSTLGKFDLSGQINAFHGVLENCRQALATLEADKSLRIRNYQTLGICCGAALVIILI